MPGPVLGSEAASGHVLEDLVRASKQNKSSFQNVVNDWHRKILYMQLTFFILLLTEIFFFLIQRSPRGQNHLDSVAQ